MLRINRKNPNGPAVSTILYAAPIIIVSLMLWSTGGRCADLVDIDVVKAGSSVPKDTLLADSSYELRIWIENDDTITATTLAFQIWSPDIATWQWENVGGLGMATGCVTSVTTSRLGTGTGSALDWTDFIIGETNCDLLGRDTLVMGGVAIYRGISPGPLEHMISIHFIPGSPQEYGYSTLCFDSCFVPPTGDFVWGDHMGYDIYPGVLWSEGGKCWTVASCACRPGDANGDGTIDIGEAVYIINYVFKGGPPPIPYPKCSGDANGDGQANVADAVYIISYVFKGGVRPPVCFDWVQWYGELQ